jgi:hypothetical protein
MNRRQFLKLIGIGAGGVGLFGMARKEAGFHNTLLDSKVKVNMMVVPTSENTATIEWRDVHGNTIKMRHFKEMVHPYYQGKNINVKVNFREWNK